MAASRCGRRASPGDPRRTDRNAPSSPVVASYAARIRAPTRGDPGGGPCRRLRSRTWRSWRATALRSARPRPSSRSRSSTAARARRSSSASRSCPRWCRSCGASGSRRRWRPTPSTSPARPSASSYDDVLAFRFGEVRGARTTYSYNVPRDRFDASVRDAALARGRAPRAAARAPRARGSGERVRLAEASLAAAGLARQPDFIVDAGGREPPARAAARPARRAGRPARHRAARPPRGRDADQPGRRPHRPARARLVRGGSRCRAACRSGS